MAPQLSPSPLGAPRRRGPPLAGYGCARVSVPGMAYALPLPPGTLDNARNLLASLRAALARHPDDARLAPALGHAAALVALLDVDAAPAFVDPNPPDPHKGGGAA
jgi:hypothetical protein